jgi:hypothetical protein
MRIVCFLAEKAKKQKKKSFANLQHKKIKHFELNASKKTVYKTMSVSPTMT